MIVPGDSSYEMYSIGAENLRFRCQIPL